MCIADELARALRDSPAGTGCGSQETRPLDIERRPEGVNGTGSGAPAVLRTVDSMHCIALRLRHLRDVALDFTTTEGGGECAASRREAVLVVGSDARALRSLQLCDNLIARLGTLRRLRFPADLVVHECRTVARKGGNTDRQCEGGEDEGFGGHFRYSLSKGESIVRSIWFAARDPRS